MTTILFRKSLEEENEYDICKKYNRTTKYRSTLLLNQNIDVVIGRYSVLPYYKELEDELALSTKDLINSYQQHSWIADVTAWAGDASYDISGPLSKWTPKSWTTWHNLPIHSSYVVKGKTNSRKFQWNKMMFAQTRDDVPRVAMKLLDDTLINEQGIVVREYIPLRRLDDSINGLQITEEWRCFFYRDRLLAHGFYWSNFPHLISKLEWTQEAQKFVCSIAETVKEYANFFVLDIARTQDGSWILIEVNDGQMSGLSLCDPHELYRNISQLTFEQLLR